MHESRISSAQGSLRPRTEPLIHQFLRSEKKFVPVLTLNWFGMTAGNNYFSVALFFVVFRETLEVSIIASVLFAFIDRLPFPDTTIPQQLRKSVWMGTLLASLIVVAIGATLVTLWYRVGTNYFESSELLYEGVFGLIASVFITITSFAFLKGQYLYDRMTAKLEAKFHRTATSDVGNLESAESSATIKTSGSDDQIQEQGSSKSKLARSQEEEEATKEVSENHKYSGQIFFWVPFVTVIREGIETVLLIGGIQH